MVPWRFKLAAMAMIFLILSSPSAAWAERDWAITLYSGRLTDSELSGSATWDFEFENSYLIDLGLSRKVYGFHDYFDVEIEGQVAKHFGDQDNWEFCLISYFRWLMFPWDEWLDTSFAAGAGLSYASSIPALEAENYDETSRLLGALMFEFAFSLPKVPQWSIAGGIHHRSGAGGTFGGVRGASNAWVVGFRYRF